MKIMSLLIMLSYTQTQLSHVASMSNVKSHKHSLWYSRFML